MPARSKVGLILIVIFLLVAALIFTTRPGRGQKPEVRTGPASPGISVATTTAAGVPRTFPASPSNNVSPSAIPSSAQAGGSPAVTSSAAKTPPADDDASISESA